MTIADDHQRSSAETEATPKPPKARVARWWVAVVAGCLVSIPLGWLLSHAALLPFFLGLFFFVLFGLVIGALMHRIAAPARPLRTAGVIVGTTVVVLSCWSYSIYQEYRSFPAKRAKEAMRDPRIRIDEGQTAEEYRLQVAANVRAYINEAYPPGGLLGYVRFVAADGVLEPSQIEGAYKTLRATHRRAAWIVRSTLSVGFLAFGVASQTFALRKKRDPLVRAIDRERTVRV